MASQTARIEFLPSLLLLVSTAAWAGRGDMDPNYGEGGQLAIGSSVLLELPEDRLVIGEGTDEGFRVRMVDATGQIVPTFGDSGVVLIDSSSVARSLWPETAALAPNGDMIFGGSLPNTSARALLRLDNNGQPVLSFGNRGDGLVEPAVTRAWPMSVAIDPDGKIFLAEGSWDPDGNSCGTPARLQRLLANGQSEVEFGGDGIVEIQNLDICNGAPVFGARADGGVIVGNGHTIVAIDAAGNIDPTFGVDGRLAISEIAWPSGQLLPDGGLLIRGLWGVSPTANDTVFLKFDRNGQPDLDFGHGTGSVTVDLGAVLLGEPFGYESVYQMALDPDGEHVVAHFGLQHADAGFVCTGIARLTIDGTPDAGFGRNGLTCLNFNLSLIAVQSDGAPLFRLPDFDGGDGIVYRLLPDNIPSPGFLRVAATTRVVGESERTATVAIERFAGRDGAVSVNYATVSRQGGSCYHSPTCRIGSATAGSDYTATSGRLDWANGDDNQRTVTVTIRDDNINEHGEVFGVDLSEPGGDVKLIGSSTTVFITDDDEASTTPPPPASGGGGSVSWATQLALLTLLFIRRRRVNR